MGNKDMVIGLDIGETSVGWAVVDNIDKCILDMGVRCWNKSEDRLGKPLSRGRREYRGRRRTTRRKSHRKQRVKNTIIKYNLLTKEQMETLFLTPGEKDIFTLRVDAIEKQISNEELTRILVRLSKNRGFKSNRKADTESEGVLNDAINENEKLMKEKGYKTVGQMILLDERFKEQKRNFEGSYIATVSRKLIKEELEIILKTQQSLGNKLITDEFIKEIINIIIEQRPFATGNDIIKMLGDCTFEKKEKRAPKATYSFSEFQVRQALNNIRLLDENRNKIELSQEQKEKVYEKIFSSSGKFTYTQVRKLLKLEENILFSKLNYDEDIKTTEKEVFVSIEEFIKIKKALKEFNLDNNQLDEIGWILSYYKTDKDIEDELIKKEFKKEVINNAININLKSSKPCHLSLKALRKINEGLKEGLIYNEACEKVGYDFKAQGKEEDKTKFLEKQIPIEEITNPTVRKALIESRNVLNAIISKYGSPTAINIELTREMAQSKKSRAKVAKAQREIKKLKDGIIAEIKNDRPDVQISSTQLLKLRLWKEQDGRCTYSNKFIDIDNVLFDETLCQIDHILPYSRSFDNSYNNRVLVLTKENQEKKNQTPYEMFDDIRWQEFEVRINSNKKIPYRKRLNLLNTTFKDDEKGFLNRNLNNTSYITDYFSKFVRENLEFEQSDRKKKVVCVNGKVTHDVRYLLGLEKDRSIETHHAVDAAIVAVIDESFIQKISKYYKERENDRYLAKKQGLKFPRPWENFEYEVKYKEKEIFISRPEKIKVTGAAQKDSIYSYKGKDENGYHIIGENVDISKLSIDKDDNLVAGKLGKVDLAHPLYKVIYDAIKNGEDLSKLKTPSKNGNGNPIRKVMVYRSAGSGNITILKGGKSAKLGGDIIRTDIFEKEKKFYFVPIYVSDTIKKELPKKAIKKTSPRDNWIDIDDSYKFKFSISKNSVLKINRKSKKEIIEQVGYVSSNPDVSEARFEMIYHDGEDIGRVTFGTLMEIKKYRVDVLGNLIEIEQEERKTFR